MRCPSAAVESNGQLRKLRYNLIAQHVLNDVFSLHRVPYPLKIMLHFGIFERLIYIVKTFTNMRSVYLT